MLVLEVLSLIPSQAAYLQRKKQGRVHSLAKAMKDQVRKEQLHGGKNIVLELL